MTVARRLAAIERKLYFPAWLAFTATGTVVPVWPMLALAAIAVATNAYGALYARPDTRRQYAGRSALSAALCVGYVVLLLGIDIGILDGSDRAEWSLRMGSVSMLSLRVMWIPGGVADGLHERSQVAGANRAIEAHTDASER